MNAAGKASGSPANPTSTLFDPAFLSASLKSLPVPPGARCCIAYSGGLDSHVLLHALCSLRDEYSFRLRAVHINHGLHPDARQWSEHCAHVCDELGVALAVRDVDIKRDSGESTEAAARQARYAALSQELQEGEYCLTAQHADDQAETVLLQLLRGAGMHGLAGMPALTTFGPGRLGRPLLGVSRSALAEYAAQHGLVWKHDPSNDDSRFDRNYLRNEVMPLIYARWPSAAHALSRSATHAASAAEMLDQQGMRDLAAVRAHALHGDSVCLACLDVALIRQLPGPRQANALRCWIRNHGIKLPSNARLTTVQENLLRDNQSGSGEVQWTGAALRRDGDLLFLCRQPHPKQPAADGSIAWDPASLLELPGYDLVLQATVVTGQGCALSRLEGRHLTVRWRQGGETCRMAAGFGRKPLRKVFQDLGIPAWQRDTVPLVYLDDELVAVSHYWVNPHMLPAAHANGIVFSAHSTQHVSIENIRTL